MIVFKLTMPGIGSWNHKWSGSDRSYIRTRDERTVPKELVGKDYSYHWDDGWVANVSVEKMDCRNAKKLLRKSAGFCGYDWMISSIIKYGYITDKDINAQGA